MGWVEAPCGLCGVSFNVRRMRTKVEPENAGELYEIDYPTADCDAKGCEKDGVGVHIPGPDCDGTYGYNGHHISVEEMRLAPTLQCLSSKTEIWTGTYSPESDDEDFERESGYFLTGLGENQGTIENSVITYPVRHGHEDPSPQPAGGICEGGMPFHPHCFEIYKRVSLLRKGKLDIDGLVDWWLHNGPIESEYVVRGYDLDSMWACQKGEEFLVANPLHPPALPAIFEAAKRPQSDFSLSNSPFDVADPTSVNTSDPFTNLSKELCDMVVGSLGSKDIASLRLVSRSFRKLPISLWHRLVLEEMPWLWEAWSDMPYPLWACTTKAELEAHDETVQAKRETLKGLSKEDKLAQEEIITREDAEYRKPRAVQTLNRLHTDWHYLYRQIKRDWASLKGLQNRKRIWHGQETLVQDIANSEQDRLDGNNHRSWFERQHQIVWHSMNGDIVHVERV